MMWHERDGLVRVVPIAVLIGFVAIAASCPDAALYAASEEDKPAGGISPAAQEIGDSDVPIPQPIVLPVTISHKPNRPVKGPYVPSQLFAPFPQRLLAPIRNQTTGIHRLAVDGQRPLADGMELLPGADFSSGGRQGFELSFRQAGVWCMRFPLLRLRLERGYLADIRFAVREGTKVWPLGKFAERSCTVRPGRVIYQLKDKGARLSVKMVVLMPLAPPAYGCMARIEVRNLAPSARAVDLIATAKKPLSGAWPPPGGALPDVPEGAARLKLVLDRYRVLWDTVIDGRLARLNPNLPETRLRRSREFCTAFWMLGERSEEAFGKWFNLRTPTHADLLQFALDPPDTAGTSMPTAGSTICPLCNCLGVFDRELLESLSPALVRQVHQDFPRWQTTDGACSQCIELYRGRPLSQAAAKLLPK